MCALLTLGVSGAWAAVTMPTLTTDEKNPVLYAIQSYRSYYFEQYAGDNAAITPTFDCSSANAKFYFIAVNGSNFDDGVKIVSSVNGKQLVDVGTGFADEGTTWYIKENPYNAGFVCISKTSNLSSGCWDCNSNGVMTTSYWQPGSGDYEGTSWSIVKAPQYETSTLENPKWYYLKTGRGRYVYADGTNAGTNTSNPKTDAYKFAFISVGGTGVNIVSKAGLSGNKYLTTSPGVSSEASTWYYFGAARYPGYFLFSDIDTGYGSSHLLNDNGNGGLAKWWVDGTGSYFQVEEVLPVCEVTYTYTYGGNTYTATETQDIGAPVSLPASINFPYTNYSFSTDVVPDASAATVNVTVAGFNMPFTVSADYANATWYYLHGHAYYSNYYISTNSTATVWNTTFSRDDAHKWAFIGNPIEGIKVINKASGNGSYLSDTDNATTMTSTATSWELKQQTANYSYGAGISFGLWSSSKSQYANCSSGTLKYWGSFDQGSTLWVDDVDAVTSDKAVLAEAIATAQALVATPGVPGFPTTEAATTLSGELTSAKAVINNESGDYGAAYISLSAAIATAKNNINYTPRTDVYYTITSTRGSMVYDSSHDSSVDAEGNKFLWYTTSLDKTNVNHLWGFIEKDDNYYMYNVGKKQFATVSTSGNYQLNDKGTWVFSDTPAYVTFDAGINNSVAAPNVRVRATVATTGTTYSMSISTSYTGPVITYDAQGDGGIPMMLAISSVAVDADVTAAMTAKVEDLTPYRNALKAVIDGCASIALGTGLNQYTASDAYNTALAAANAAYGNDNATKSDLQTAKTNLETAISGLVLNLPSTGFYRIKGKTSSKFLAADLASNSKFNMTDATDATTVFYFDGTKLVNFYSGKANGMTAAAWAWVTGDVASTVTFSDGATNGGYTIQSSNAYFYDDGDGSASADRGNSLGDNVRYRSWYLEEVKTLPVTIGAAKYATLYAPVALTIPTGVTAYTAVDDGNYLTLTAIEGNVIPANTGVILAGEANTYNFTVTTGGSVSSNALTGTVAAIARPAGSYILATGGSGVGFYADGASTIPGFKAYLPSGSGSVKSFRFADADAIRNISSAPNKSEVYDLQGRRVAQPAHGLYIVNGKKVVIK